MEPMAQDTPVYKMRGSAGMWSARDCCVYLLRRHGSEKTTQVASSEGESGEGVGERGISLLEILSNLTAEVFPFKLYLLCFLETLLQCFFLVAAIGRHSNDATAIGDHLPVFCACS